MKIYEILGLSRSGHHTVTNWIIKNTIGFQCDWKYKLTDLGGTGLFYLNEANHDIPLSFQYVNEKKDQIKKLYLNYEDTPGDYTIFNNDNIFKGPMSLKYENSEFLGRIIILRDFYDLLSSRLKLNQAKINKEWIGDTEFILEVGEKYIYRWKSQAKAALFNNTPYLRFEDWITNKEVREKFLLDNFGLKDHFGTKGIEGTPSSFGDRKDVLKRDGLIGIPEETKDLIRKDNELHYLIGALGYKYKEI